MAQFARKTDMLVTAAELYFIPVQMRVPLKFGLETVTSIIVARVKLTVRNQQGKTAIGWGESPLSVKWGWPSKLSYELRQQVMRTACGQLCESLVEAELTGHALEIGYDFQQQYLHPWLENLSTSTVEPMPYLASLLCLAPLDLALHDAFGQLSEADIYDTYTRDYLSRDLGYYLRSKNESETLFANKYIGDFLIKPKSTKLRAWHLIGGLDPIEPSDLNGDEPNDGFPVLLEDWIKADGLTCLKIKLRGNDAAWDYARLVKIGQIALKTGVKWLAVDFNCTVIDPLYVTDILDRLHAEQTKTSDLLLYVEQPFPYDLEKYAIDVHSVTERKPLFLDESAHDWAAIRLGRELGWNGVALKTCKTQTGALLSLCWAKAKRMQLMVQDLTNPMLAQVPHIRLAAHAGTIMGVETNAMQFCPLASLPEAVVHPNLYQRRHGAVDFGTLSGSGFGYRINEINRKLPEAAGKWLIC